MVLVVSCLPPPAAVLLLLLHKKRRRTCSAGLQGKKKKEVYVGGRIMSLITDDPEQSPRDCSSRSRKPHHHNHGGGRRALIAVSSAVASLLSLAVILWLALRPSNPSFSLLAATATEDNATIVVVDAALTVHNPNAHATALYDRLRASASYGGVPLGAGAPPLPPLEVAGQGDAVLTSSWRRSSSGWRSAGGQAALLRVRVEGQLRWKVAAWVSGRHGLTVDCVAAVVLVPSSSSSSAVAEQMQQQQQQGSSSQCASYI